MKEDKKTKNISKKSLLVIIPLSLIILAGIGYASYYIYRENLKRQIVVDITICTLGDSLTDGGYYNVTYAFGEDWHAGYQPHTYEYLKTRSVESSIHNLGISGQTVKQICGRFNDSVPSDYIVSMAGTNDLWRANYSIPGIASTLSQLIISTYNQTIFNTIAYQIAQGFESPVIVICSIPPVGNVTGLPVKMAETITLVNMDLKTYVLGLNRADVLFCDVNRAMRNADGYMIPSLCADGVHFKPDGNVVCGEAVAQVIFDHYYSH